MIVVQKCIGCGMIENAQLCTGDCRERRLELVESDGWPQRLACSDWEALRAAAREALRDLQPVTAWACDSCGRVEAPTAAGAATVSIAAEPPSPTAWKAAVRTVMTFVFSAD